jgi:hypothetical protein
LVYNPENDEDDNRQEASRDYDDEKDQYSSIPLIALTGETYCTFLPLRGPPPNVLGISGGHPYNMRTWGGSVT